MFTFPIFDRFLQPPLLHSFSLSLLSATFGFKMLRFSRYFFSASITDIFIFFWFFVYFFFLSFHFMFSGNITLIALKLNATTLSKLKCLFTQCIQNVSEFYFQSDQLLLSTYRQTTIYAECREFSGLDLKILYKIMFSHVFEMKRNEFGF